MRSISNILTHYNLEHLSHAELPSSPLHLHNPVLTLTTYHYLYYHLLYPLGMAHVFGIPVGSVLFYVF